MLHKAGASEVKMVNVPKARNTYCAKCNKHGKFKVGDGAGGFDQGGLKNNRFLMVYSSRYGAGLGGLKNNRFLLVYSSRYGALNGKS